MSEKIRCNTCKGKGTVELGTQSFINAKGKWGPERTIENVCPRCKGAGKLDWIERITGKAKHTTLVKACVINLKENPVYVPLFGTLEPRGAEYSKMEKIVYRKEINKCEELNNLLMNGIIYIQVSRE